MFDFPTFAHQFTFMENKNEKHEVVDETVAGTEDAESSEATNDPIPDELSAEEILKAELELQKDKYVRLFAEFDNFKRRNAKERMELLQTAGKDVLIPMLDVLDDCDRAEKQINTTDDVKQVREGVQLVFNKLRTALQAKGIKPMESIGTDFDVEKHEAVTEIEAGEKQEGKVVDEIVKGYYLNDKLIRFAKVVVGK
ncbi:nucleotide exchange factor GrpE [soil metagenome]